MEEQTGIAMRWTKRKKMITAILLVVMVALFASGVVLKDRILTPETLLKILPDEADFHIRDFVFTEVGSNQEKWEIRAKTAEYDKKKNHAQFDDVKIKMTTAEGRVFEMTGDRASMETDSKTVEMTGNVVVISDSGDRFSTDQLRYSDKQKKLSTESPLWMKNERMEIEAVGMTVDINRGELALLSRVRAKIH